MIGDGDGSRLLCDSRELPLDGTEGNGPLLSEIRGEVSPPRNAGRSGDGDGSTGDIIGVAGTD